MSVETHLKRKSENIILVFTRMLKFYHREGAIDRLQKLYKNTVLKTGVSLLFLKYF